MNVESDRLLGVRRIFLSSVKAFLQAWRFLPLTAWRTTAGATRDDDRMLVRAQSAGRACPGPTHGHIREL